MTPDPVPVHTEQAAPSVANRSILPEAWRQTRYGNVFLNDEDGALRIVPVADDIFENGIPLYLQYNYPYTGSLPIAVDASDNIYSYYSDSGSCLIFAQSY